VQLLAFFILMSALLAQGARPDQRRIIAYVFGERADHSRIGAEKLTHINYAFGLVDEACEIVLSPEAPRHLRSLRALKAKNPDLKIILSVGGWGADNFSDAALTDSTRLQFTNSAIDVIRKHSLDGIDLDWEYPGQPGPGIKFRAEDKENFTLLLKMLRTRLDSLSDERRRTGSNRYTLSIASSGDDEYFQNTEMDKLHVYLDWINIMTYDFSGDWSTRTAHHARLYHSLESGDGAFAAGYVWQHLNAGIPSHKLVLGAPFYGKAWTEVVPDNNGLNQLAGCFVRGNHSYSMLERAYINQLGYKRYWDEVARAPFLWNEVSRTLIVYDDPASLQEKAQFVKQHGLGGMMYWEHSHDPAEVLLTTIYKNLR
jgi:chitinase